MPSSKAKQVVLVPKEASFRVLQTVCSAPKQVVLVSQTTFLSSHRPIPWSYAYAYSYKKIQDEFKEAGLPMPTVKAEFGGTTVTFQKGV